MGSRKIFTDLWSLMMMICTFVCCCLRRSVLCACATLKSLLRVYLSYTSKQETRFNAEGSKSRYTSATVEPADYDYGSWDADFLDFQPAQTSRPRDHDIVSLMNKIYCSKTKQMNDVQVLNYKLTNMGIEQNILSNSIKVLEKRISILEETLYQEKTDQKDFQTAVRDEFIRRDDLSVKELSFLQDTNELIQKKIQKLKVSSTILKISTSTNFQNLFDKLECLNKKTASFRPIDIEAISGRLNEMIVQLQETVGILVADMKSLALNMGNKSEEIDGLKSELAAVKRNYRHKETKNYLFNTLRTADIKKFKIHTKNNFKRLETRLMTATPAPSATPSSPVTPVSSETPVPPVSLAATANRVPAAPPLPTASSCPPLKASRKPDVEVEPSLSIELFKNAKLRKVGEEPKKVYRLPVSVPKCDGKEILNLSTNK